jgi:hypothetical protein
MISLPTKPMVKCWEPERSTLGRSIEEPGRAPQLFRNPLGLGYSWGLSEHEISCPSLREQPRCQAEATPLAKCFVELGLAHWWMRQLLVLGPHPGD